ncbi:unnamed protein product [Owenia fusiformis]|uniref:Farnesyl pyrophosphate synthase n=1 Tax=Owenia fusiformis TaxID=6347 RepID=A0A8J1U1G8_OWEFU|nr:unnamed protein product [Owenia fusiformis]
MEDNNCIKKMKLDVEVEEFNKLFEELNEENTIQWGEKVPEVMDAMLYFKEVAAYNVPFGKKNRGMTVINSYCHMIGSAKVTEENKRRARILGWCIEWLQAFFLVADDIMDKSELRRGKPCWYKKESVGMNAVNDAFQLEMCVYDMLKRHFRDQPYYVDLLELFHEVSGQTIIGQNLDMLASPIEGKVDFSTFTMEKYSAIVKWKTAFYSFYLPVACAMYQAGLNDEVSHQNAKTILLKMGHFFQIQDDYLDCYGDPKVIGKVGRDIEENKCSWLIVQALQRASPEQLQILNENYAKDDPANVAKVKTVYNELNLKQVYADFEEESYSELIKTIEQQSGDLPQQMFLDLAEKIYKRKK